jgi:cyclophilin family peptidyl-prolyl cis-trans isomerase
MNTSKASKSWFPAISLAVVVLAACGGSSKTTVGSAGATTTTNASSSYGTGTGGTTAPTTAASTGATGDFKADPTKTYAATIATNMGTIVITLDAKSAPIASGRFIELARAGFYDGLTFHRVVPNFVIQGGDPAGTGAGTSGRPPVVGEVPTDNYPIGSLAAAKTGSDPPGTFDCQFFIVTGAGGASLSNDYARFGMVTAGSDVAKKIEDLNPGGDGSPTKKVTITKITIAES